MPIADGEKGSVAPSGGQSEAPQEEQEPVIVLAAVDTSPPASRVVDMASRVVRRMWQNAQLHLVHVFHAGHLERGADPSLPLEELVDEAKEYLDYHVRIAQRQCGRAVTGHFVEGDAEDEIVRLARSLGADLVIVGTGDPSGIRRWLGGSVAEKVVKNAPCAVFVVRSKQRRYIKVA
ncbi:MAG: universal stress protein [Polyangiaceae bacterium]